MSDRTNTSRVVSIDLDDDATIGNLVRAWVVAKDRRFGHDAVLAEHEFAATLASTLETLLPDSKPAEPTGLGAVVIDAMGRTWVRRHPAGEAWVNGYQRWAEYADLDVVKVLHRGVDL